MSNDYLFNEMKTVVSPSLIYYRDIIQKTFSWQLQPPEVPNISGPMLKAIKWPM